MVCSGQLSVGSILSIKVQSIDSFGGLREQISPNTHSSFISVAITHTVTGGKGLFKLMDHSSSRTEVRGGAGAEHEGRPACYIHLVLPLPKKLTSAKEAQTEGTTGTLLAGSPANLHSGSFLLQVHRLRGWCCPQ